MMGIIFALIYVYIIRGWLTKIASPAVKGIVFGIIAFIMALMGMMLMRAILPNMPMPEGSATVLTMAGLMGYVVSGIVVALVAKASTPY